MIRTRTEYSFRAAHGKIEDIVPIVKSGWPHYALPIADFNSTFGFSEWEKQCKRNDVLPIYGAELAVSPNPDFKKPLIDRWTFIALNHDSLQSLNRIVGLAHKQAIKGKPIISYAQALKMADLFKVVGHRFMVSKFDKLISSLTIEEVNILLENLYIGLSPALSVHLFDMVTERGIQSIPVYDNRFIRESDRGYYHVKAGKTASMKSYPQHILGYKDWRESVSRFGDDVIDEAMMNLDWDFSESRFSKTVPSEMPAKLQTTTLIKPKKTHELFAIALLKLDLLFKLDKLHSTLDEYKKRLQYEYNTIVEKDFLDYFQIVYELCQFANNSGIIIGPGRGSSSGSLFCYLLGITQVDPIKFGLIFERFIDLNRTDWPDIDIDFPYDGRDLIFDYLSELYGRDYIAKLSTVIYYRPKLAIQETIRSTGLPREHVYELLNNLVKTDLKDYTAIKQTLEFMTESDMYVRPELSLMQSLEGTPRHFSQHPSAVIMSKRPLDELVARDLKTDCILIEMNDAERIGLLKIDILGLTQLSIFNDIFKQDHVLETINQLVHSELDDELTLELFNSGKLTGIFQFAGQALANLTGTTRVTCFNDLCILTSLARPGPLNSGQANAWIGQNKRVLVGKRPVALTNPVLRATDIFEDTYNVLVYQEQVMRLCREIGQMEWADVIKVRKAIGKSQGHKALEKYRKKWHDGAVKSGMTDDDAESIWEHIVKFGRYGFNKSHSVAYSLISYISAFLKVHYPLEYAAAFLNYEKDKDICLIYLRELENDGVEIVPIDRDRSTDKWQYDYEKNQLIGPLTNIVGIGPVMVQQILKDRELGHPHKKGARDRLEKGEVEFSSLYPIRDGIRQVCPDLTKIKILSKPIPIEVWNNYDDTFEELEGLAIGAHIYVSEKDQNAPDKVEKRGKKLDGFTKYLSFKLQDDTGTIYARIQTRNIHAHNSILARMSTSKFIAVKGTLYCHDSFRMIIADRWRIIG